MSYDLPIFKCLPIFPFFNFWKWGTISSSRKENLSGSLPVSRRGRGESNREGGRKGQWPSLKGPRHLETHQGLPPTAFFIPTESLSKSKFPWTGRASFSAFSYPPEEREKGEKAGRGRVGEGPEKGSLCLHILAPSWGGGGAAALQFYSPCEQRSAVEI